MNRLFFSKACLCCVALLFAGAGFAQAENTSTRDAVPVKSSRVSGGEPGPSGDANAPGYGLKLYERMDADLPPLPPEKPYAGVVDDAYGAYQRGLYATAFNLALARAEKGDGAAQTLLAEMFSQGKGVRRSIKDAVFWYGEAAKSGNPVAMFKYSLMLLDGEHVARDRTLAQNYMSRAAEAGNALAEFNWAQMLAGDDAGDEGLAKALPFYEKAADQGLADAQYAVAQIYAGLESVPAEKKALARDYLRRAALSGHDTAQHDMGVWLIEGIGGAADFDAGFQWMKVAALRGNVAAQNKLALLYVNAIGTRPDPVEAVKWYLLSRRAGLADDDLEDFYLGVSEGTQKKAAEAATRFLADRGRAAGESLIELRKLAGLNN